MEKDKKLSKDAKPSEMTLRGTISKPDLVTDGPAELTADLVPQSEANTVTTTDSEDKE